MNCVHPTCFCPFTYLQQKKLLSPLGCSPKIHHISCTKSQIGKLPPKKKQDMTKKTRKTHIQKNAAKMSTSFSTIQHGFRSFSPLTINIGCLMSIRFLDFDNVDMIFRQPPVGISKTQRKFQRRCSHFSKIPRRNPFEKIPVIFKYTRIHPRSLTASLPLKNAGNFFRKTIRLPIGTRPSVAGFRGFCC